MAIKIFVDQGHNPYGFNAGAEGFGAREQDITYIVGAYLADILAADYRFEVATSRQNPTEILGYDNSSSLRERVDMANTWGADYFISIHVNANVNPSINGTESYVYAEGSPSYNLGTEIVKETEPNKGGAEGSSTLADVISEAWERRRQSESAACTSACRLWER